MYDDHDYDDRWYPREPEVLPPQNDVVTHLVFVGGRLAETWTEDARHTRYAAFARSLADERSRPELPPDPPAPPEHLQVLAWLSDVTGGRTALLAMTDDPLTDDDTEIPEVDRAADHRRLAAVVELIDGAANVLLRQQEWGIACRRALVMLWTSDPDAVTQSRSAAQVAAGIVWAVGKANGWFPTSGLAVCTQSELRDHFGLPNYPSSYGKTVQSTLRRAWPTAGRPWRWGRALTPDLEPLGCPDLLTSSARRTLLRLRDQALASEQIATASELEQAG